MRFLVWSGVRGVADGGGRGGARRGRASGDGIQLGAEPAPFRVDYRLEAPRRFVTSELELTATAEGWSRDLLLTHDGSGAWQAEVTDGGDVPGGPWDG